MLWHDLKLRLAGPGVGKGEHRFFLAEPPRARAVENGVAGSRGWKGEAKNRGRGPKKNVSAEERQAELVQDAVIGAVDGVVDVGKKGLGVLGGFADMVGLGKVASGIDEAFEGLREKREERSRDRDGDIGGRF